MSKIAAAALFLALYGCAGKGEPEINRELELVLKGDLRAMVRETEAGGSSLVLDRPYFRVEDYKVTRQSYEFERKAEATFFYLKAIRIKQIRKYRYSYLANKWERYYKEMEYNLPKPRSKKG